MKNAILAVALASLAAACGSSSNSSSGSVHGKSFSVSDSLFATTTDSGTYGLGIALTSISNACAEANSTADSNSLAGQVLILEIINSPSAVTTGTYTLSQSLDTNSTFIVAGFETSDGSGSEVVPDLATSGSFTISALSATKASGTYTLTFADGSLSGSFDASQCSALVDSDSGSSTN